MGAWAAGSFDNDVASEWAADLADGGDLAMVRDALATAASCPWDEELDADEGATALAAAEVVAAAAGRALRAVPMGSSGPHALAWAAAHPGVGAPKLIELAQAAVDRATGAGSELSALWTAEADAASREWFGEVEELRIRLAG